MIHQHKLKAEDVRAFALEIMKKNFQIEANGYICKTDTIYDVLLKASAECSSLEAACADLEEVADSITAICDLLSLIRATWAAPFIETTYAVV